MEKINSLLRKLIFATLIPVILMAPAHAGVLDFLFGPHIVHISDLPPWQGDTSELLWVDARESPSFGEHKQQPDLRIGAQRTEAIIHPYALDEIRDGNALPLPGGWEVLKSNKSGCLEYELILRRLSDHATVTWTVKRDRTENFVVRRLMCLGGNATAYYGVLANSRYFAFVTADTGWIFFDRIEGKFLPLVVVGNVNHSSNLFVDKKGQILVEIQPDRDGKTSDWDGPSADGVRQVIFEGKPLIASWDPSELKDVKRANEYRECVSAAFNKDREAKWRAWYEAKKKDPNAKQASSDRVDVSSCNKP